MSPFLITILVIIAAIARILGVDRSTVRHFIDRMKVPNLS